MVHVMYGQFSVFNAFSLKLVIKMSSCEEAQQSLTSPQHSTSLPSSMSWSTPRNRSIFFSVLVGMVVVAVVAIACVMVTVTVTTSDSQQTFKQPRQLVKIMT